MAAEGALPALVSKLVLDGTAAEATIAKFAAKVKNIGKNATAGNTSLLGGLIGDAGKIEQSIVHLGSKIKSEFGSAGSAIEKTGKLFENLAKSVLNAGKAIGEGGSGLFGAGGALAGGVPVLGGIVLGVTGLVGGLAALENKVAETGAAVLRNSELLGMNTQMYQGLTNAVALFGVSQEQANLVLLRFERNLAAGAPQLKSLGLTLHDIGITSSDAGTAINQLSTFLQKDTNEVQRNAVGLALLGRSGASMIEVLSKGPEVLQGYTAYLQRMGVILDDNQLHTAALANTINNQFKVSLQGLETQVGLNLMNAFNNLYAAILKAFGNDPKRMFAAIGQAISNVISFLAGLIQGLFNVKLAFDGVVGVVDKNAAAYNDLSAATQALSDGTDNGLEPSLTATKNTLTALEQATKNQTEAINAQVKALDDQQTSLQNQVSMTDLLMQQQDLQGTSYLGQLEDQLNYMQNVDDSRRKSGETLLDYRRRQEEKQTKNAIDAQKKQEDIFKNTEQIQLESARQVTDAKKEALQQQLTALQDNLNSSQQAAQNAAAEGNTLMAGAGAATKSNLNSISSAFGDISKNSQTTAQQMGQSFGQAIQGMIGQVGQLISSLNTVVGMMAKVAGFGGSLVANVAGATGKTSDILRVGVKQIMAAGNTSQINAGIGAVVNTGTINEDDQMSLLETAGTIREMQLEHMKIPQSTWDKFNKLRSEYNAYASGGWINEPVIGVGLHSGEGYSFAEHGSEHVANENQMASGAHGGAGIQVDNHFYGPVADTLVASRVTRKNAQQLRAKGLKFAGGIS